MRHSSTRPTKGKAPQRRRRTQEDDNEVPEVYREMLAEAEARTPQSMESDKPIKRRKVGERSATATPVAVETTRQEIAIPEDKKDDSRQPQTAYESDASSEDLDIEWEDIDLQQTPLDSTETPGSKESDEPLQITFGLGNKEKKKITPRHKPLSAAEKKLRLDTHKAHLLCLLRHVHLRNLWCNDSVIQDLLKSMLLPRNIVSLLNPPENQDKLARSRTFMNGLNLAGEAFGKKFKLTNPGIRRAHWADNPESLKQKSESIMLNTEVFLSTEDFRKQAKNLAGSRDFGAQLFCALLRSAAVEARLVCSLQPLPFSGATKNMSPGKPKSYHATIPSDDRESPSNKPSKANASANTSRPGVRRLGQPKFAPSRPASTSARMDPPARPPESSYPVFWVEAFNEGAQKWIAVDPLVTKSLAKPHILEPPGSDHLNIMSYVIAFDEDTTARDVTRRYTRAFNAKTRKLRVESTKGGELWWRKTMDAYEKPFMTDRDATEVSELTSKAAGEPMPRNIQDFKDHPFYALERHLRRNEVIFPKRVIGHVAVGKSGSQNEGQETVYRRSDVHIVRSADKWYRLGRDIKLGEQPLKRVPAHRNKTAGIAADDEGELYAAETPLYAEYQTQLYNPPPVVKGKIPRNAYGNLDIYTSNMVPSGGVHVKHPDAALAAKILAIDYVPAVTGFDFRGRHGTAVVHGIVIASECHAAVELVTDGLEGERRLAEIAEQSAQALRLWKHFLLKLRVAERVKGYAVEGDSADRSEQNSDEPDDTAGGFLPESDHERSSPVPGFDRGPHQAHSQTYELENDNSYSPAAQNESLGGGFIPDESEASAEQGGRMEFAQEYSTGITEQPTERLSQYSLVVVPNDEIPNDETRVPVDLRLAEPEPNTNTYPQQMAIDTGEGAATETINLCETDAAEEPRVEESKPTSSQGASRASPLADSPRNPQVPADKDSDSDYQGSMLSEDPEDVDSFPEWLL